MISEKIKRRAMKIVASRSRDDVDSAGLRDTRGEIKIDSRDLKFLHRFLGKAHLGARISRRHDAASVHGNAGSATAVAARCAQHRQKRSAVKGS